MYEEFWCSTEMRQYDPEGCGIGLAVGYVGLPMALIVAIIAIVIAVKGK